MTTKTAVIYARVSTTRQAADGLPIESQIEQARAKAEALGAQVVEVFCDEGISGRTANRPAFQRAIDLCGSRKIDYFIAWSGSRFARNKIDAASHKALLKRWGTRLVYASSDIDIASDEGWFIDSMLEVVDEQYSRQIAKDTRRSMAKNARDGFFNGGAVPFGYRAVDYGKRRKLEPEPIEALIVREVFQMYVGGLGAKEIAMRLNSRSTLRRGANWSKNNVTSLLKNARYTGRITYNRTLDKQLRPEEEWIYTPAHEAIVSDEEFAAVQRTFAARTPTRGGGSPRSKFAFTGLLRCGLCGNASMQIETATGRSSTYSYYNCRSAIKGMGCTNRRLAAETFDTWLIGHITTKIFTRARVVEIIREIHELKGEWAKARDEKIRVLRQEVQSIERKIEKLFQLLELHGAETPNLGDLTTRLRAHKARRETLQQDIEKLEFEEPPQAAISENDVAEATALFTEMVKSADRKTVRTFLRSFIQSITVTSTAAIIEYCPEKLVNTPADLVHSRPEWWLPNRTALRTATIEFSLADFRRAA